MRNYDSTKMTHGIAATLAIGLLAACSPDDGAGKVSAPLSPAHAALPADNRTAATEAESLCDLLTPGEIEASFNGAIQVVVDSGTDRVCEYRIAGHEGQLLLQRMDARTYNDRKAIYSGPAYGDIAPVAVAGLGQNAYTMGDAQIEVQVNDLEAFNLALTLLTTGELPFTPQQGRSALIELAGTVAGRL